MTGNELFRRMKAKEIGVILESREDAEQLAVLLSGIPYADELVEWYDHRNARIIVNSNDGRERLLFASTLSRPELPNYCRECVPLSALIFQNQINVSSLDDFV